ncbi:MAG: ribosomal protein S18-alanine N-acetyltransferase [Gammaproteobacteria bacterium]|jgi:ribosomal-protein-alanine N-acetyltransferase
MSSLQNTLMTSFVSMNDSHIDQVFEIECKSYGYPWSKKIFIDCLKNNYLCKVLILNNDIIGYSISSIVQDECHIMNLCVDAEFRGSGYGRLILRELHDEIKDMKCKIVFLECRPTNNSALRLYNSEGYNEIGVRKNYYPAPHGYEDAIMLAKYV